MRTRNSLPILTSVFVVLVIIANIMSCRIIAPMGISMDAGTILFPLTFIVRDMIHRNYGRKAANRAVIVGVLSGLFASLMFYITSTLPADMSVGAQTEFGLVLLPSILIVIGSAIGMLISEYLDGHIYERLYKGKHPYKAAIGSNTISIPIDTAIVSAIAFLPMYGLEVTFGIWAVNVVIKYIMMIVFIPSIKLTKNF